MILIEQAKQLISEGKCSVAAVTPGGEVYTDSGASVRPLFRLYTEHKAELKGAAVADKIIGKAAACLLCDIGVSEAFAFLMSQSGLELLESHGIKTGYAELVPIIENRTGTDMCPMEKAVDGAGDIAQCVANIAKFIAASL